MEYGPGAIYVFFLAFSPGFGVGGQSYSSFLASTVVHQAKTGHATKKEVQPRLWVTMSLCIHNHSSAILSGPTQSKAREKGEPKRIKSGCWALKRGRSNYNGKLPGSP